MAPAPVEAQLGGDAVLDRALKMAVSQPRFIRSEDGGGILALALHCEIPTHLRKLLGSWALCSTENLRSMPASTTVAPARILLSGML